jgi:hypothetical protein
MMKHERTAEPPSCLFMVGCVKTMLAIGRRLVRLSVHTPGKPTNVPWPVLTSVKRDIRKERVYVG